MYSLDFSIYTVHTQLNTQPARCSVVPVLSSNLCSDRSACYVAQPAVLSRCDTIVHTSSFSPGLSLSLSLTHTHTHKYKRTISLSLNHAHLSLTHSRQQSNTRTPDDITRWKGVKQVWEHSTHNRWDDLDFKTRVSQCGCSLVGHVPLTMQACQSQHAPSMRRLQHRGDSCSTDFTQYSATTIFHTLGWMHMQREGGLVSDQLRPPVPL